MSRAVIIALVFLIFSSAKADPLTFTSGSAHTAFDQFGLNASGVNISIQGAAAGGGQYAFATCTPSPCGPGSVLNVGGVFLAFQLNNGNVFGGFATVNGTSFSGVNFNGALNFTGSAVLPADFVNGQPFSVPFTMQGQLQGSIRCPQDPFGCSVQVFDISVNGSGIATATLPEFGSRIVTYNFQSAPDAMPEPATLTLLGIGLLGLKRFQSSRSKR